jgi:hypothetical protein
MTRTYRLSLISGLLAGYIVLAALFYTLSSEPGAAAADLVPMFLVGAIGIAVLYLSPSPKGDATSVAGRFLTWVTGCGQRLSGWQFAALVAAGFTFGVLLSKLLRLVA